MGPNGPQQYLLGLKREKKILRVVVKKIIVIKKMSDNDNKL